MGSCRSVMRNCRSVMGNFKSVMGNSLARVSLGLAELERKKSGRAQGSAVASCLGFFLSRESAQNHENVKSQSHSLRGWFRCKKMGKHFSGKLVFFSSLNCIKRLAKKRPSHFEARAYKSRGTQREKNPHSPEGATCISISATWGMLTEKIEHVDKRKTTHLLSSMSLGWGRFPFAKFITPTRWPILLQCRVLFLVSWGEQRLLHNALHPTWAEWGGLWVVVCTATISEAFSLNTASYPQQKTIPKIC